MGELLWDWEFWARPKQIPPTVLHSVWAIIAGRGFGKTRTGAQWVRKKIEQGYKRIAIIGETQKDLEKVMVEGESGILSVMPPHMRPEYVKKPVELLFPNGALVSGFNATEPDQLRGPQFDAAWCDEFAKYRYAEEVWDMLQFCLRLGDDPQTLLTTTPRPIKILREILSYPDTVVTTGSTFENLANLSKPFLKRMERYKGTKKGRQELEAQLLDEAEGALWTRDMLDAAFVKGDLPRMQRVVVGVDPATTSKEKSDETGIIVAGVGYDGYGYIIEDKSGRYKPGEWAKVVVDLYHKHGANAIVVETNQGGEMVKHTIDTVEPMLPITEVHAKQGKLVRAEPVSALYEQGRMRHVANLTKLEDQMVTWEPNSGDESPDRLDAAVYAVTDLLELIKAQAMGNNPSDMLIEPFKIPDYWKRVYAIDQQENGTVTIVFGTFDAATNELVIHADYQSFEPSPPVVASVIRVRGDWVPGMALVDGKQDVKKWASYIAEGIKAEIILAEKGLAKMAVKDAMALQQIKVMKTATKTEAELRQINSGTDDLPFVRCVAALMQQGQIHAESKQTGVKSAPAHSQSTLAGL